MYLAIKAKQKADKAIKCPTKWHRVCQQGLSPTDFVSTYSAELTYSLYKIRKRKCL